MAISACTNIILEMEEFADLSAEDLDVFTKILENQQKTLSPEQAADALARMKDDYMKKRLNQKRGRIFETRLVMEKLRYVQKTWSDNPGLGIEAKMVGVNNARKDALNSTGTAQRSLANEWREVIHFAMLSVSVEKNGVKITGADVLKSRHLDSEISTAVHRLSREVPESVADLDEMAVKIARVIKEANEMVISRKNGIPGVEVRDLFGYVTRNNMDQNRVRLAAETLRENGLFAGLGRVVAGRVDRDKKTNFEAWRDFIVPRLDHDRTFGADLSPKEIDEFLQNVWKTYSNGGHLKYISESSTKSVADKMNEARILHYRDGAAFEEVNRIFGTGSLQSALYQGLEHNAKGVVLLEQWGPNPQNTFNQVMDGVKKRYGLSGGMQKRLENDFKVIDGSINIPGSEMAAQVMATSRAIETMSKLGNAGLSALADPEFMASANRYLGSGFFSSYGKTLRAIFHDGLTPEDRARIVKAIGIANDTHRGELLAGATIDNVPRTMSKGMELTFKLNGLNWLTNKYRKAMNVSLAGDLGHFAGRSFADIDPAFQRSLIKMGIDDEVWDAVVSKAKFTDSEGRVYIVPEAVKDATDADISSTIKGRLAGIDEAFKVKSAEAEKAFHEAADAGDFDVQEVLAFREDLNLQLKNLEIAKDAQKKRAVRETRNDIELQVRNWFTDVVDSAVVTPNARTQAIMTQGTRRGTPEGEAIRSVGQFKSFPIAVYQQVVGRELHGRGEATGLVGAANNLWESKNIINNPNGEAAAMVQNVMGSAVFGYIAMSAKDIAKGKEPRIPENSEEMAATMASALLQGGGLGILGDLLWGDTRDRYGRSAISGFLGPQSGSAEDILDLWGRAVRGDDLAAKGFSDLIQATPFMNVFYLRMTMDYLLLYNLREAMNPGFLRRMEKRVKDNNAQEFFLPPSSYVPRGGTNPLEATGSLIEEITE